MNTPTQPRKTLQARRKEFATNLEVVIVFTCLVPLLGIIEGQEGDDCNLWLVVIPTILFGLAVWQRQALHRALSHFCHGIAREFIKK